MTPNGYGLSFHHFGLAVRDAERAVRMLEGLGYRIGEQIHDPLQKVMLTWCEHEAMPAVELVSPSEEPGPLDNLLSSQPELLYHLCYESVDIAASTAAISGDGIRVITVSAPKPAVLFGGRQVGFYQVRGFGLIEIVQAA